MQIRSPTAAPGSGYGACYGLTIVDALHIAQLCKSNHTKYHLELAQNEMLAIDDLDTEPVEVMDYGNIITPVINLLTKRYEAHLFTIVTTNLYPKEIHKRYGDRIADRLNVSFPVTMQRFIIQSFQAEEVFDSLTRLIH